MSQFTDPIRAEQCQDDRRFWRTLDAFEYHVGSEDSDEVISVPVGFRTDFQSIPRPVWSIFGHPLDEYAASGLGHDCLYQFPSNGVGRDRSRRRCDQIFLEMNKVLGCPWWKRTGKYTGVRIGGWIGWGRYRGREKAARKAVAAIDALYRKDA